MNSDLLLPQIGRMREIYLSYDDHELFDGMFSTDKIAFIMSHMDAFKVMWKEQGKAFWCRHLTMYRHHCYNVGTVQFLHRSDMNKVTLSLECLTILADQIFVILHDEFVNSRYGTAKELIHDLFILLGNKNLISACRNPSIRYNPFYLPETRDVFRKLLGCCKCYPDGIKDFFLLHMAYPIYGIFGGSVYHVLKHWLSAPDIRTSPEIYLENCWDCPPEILNSSLKPQPYHRHLLELHGAYVDKLLVNGCFGLFSSNRLVPDGEDCSDSSDDAGRVFEEFLQYVKKKHWHPSHKVTPEDIKTNFISYLKIKAEDIENEEFRRAVVLQMAEKKFQLELKKEENITLNQTDKSKCKSKGKLKDNNGHKSENNSERVFYDLTSHHCTEDPNSVPVVMVPKNKKDRQGTCKAQHSAKGAGGHFILTELCKIECCCESQTNNLKSQDPSDDEIDKGFSAVGVPIETKDRHCQTHASLETTSCGTKSKKRNKKKKGGVTAQNSKPFIEDSKPSVETDSKPLVEKDSKPNHETNNGQGSSSSSSPLNPQHHKKSKTVKTGTADAKASKGTAAELAQIKKNIDSINQAVQEKNGLSLDNFRLMVETGSLLMSGNTKESTSEPVLHNCAHCSKTEDKSKCFKKCARCKQENIKWVRYYCSRECQAENWASCHKEEHENGLLAKK